MFERALDRAGITTGDVTLHTLRHTAITRMLASGVDDYTVMETVGHLTRAMGDELHFLNTRMGRFSASR